MIVRKKFKTVFLEIFTETYLSSLNPFIYDEQDTRGTAGET